MAPRARVEDNLKLVTIFVRHMPCRINWRIICACHAGLRADRVVSFGKQMKRFSPVAIIGIAWLFAGVLTSASKADVVYLGQRAEITTVWYACPLEGDLQRLKALSQESRKAATRFSKRHHCKILRPGETGVVQNARVWTEDTCLRLQPEGGCYWFPEPFVKKGKQLVGADLLDLE